jgi:hypothetical protein
MKHKEPLRRQAGRITPGDTIRYRVVRGVGVPTYGYPHDAGGWKEVEGVHPYKDWDGHSMIMLTFADNTTKRLPARETVQVRA